jgi:surfeit locus 1 family protein
VPTVATLVALAVFVAAGNWQRGRMHEKERLRAAFDAAAQAPALSAAALPPAGDGAAWAALRYRPVAIAGEFDAARQIYVDNRVHAGRAGYHVVAPLKLADGRVILVNRGWAAAGATRAELPSAPPPPGAVVVRGRLAIPSSGYLELKPGAMTDRVWLNLDPGRFATATGIAVLPAIVEQTEPTAPDDTLVRAWPVPDFGVDKHWIYMLQWYGFAALAVVLWLALNWQRTPADAPPAAPPSPPAADG